MIPRLCWFCEHFIYTNADGGYSEMTPGWDFNISCARGQWTFDAYQTSQAQFGRILRSAEKCGQFEVSDELREEVEE